MEAHRRPEPGDAADRVQVRFRIGKKERTGELRYWPGHGSTRPPTVWVDGTRYHPEPDDVELVDKPAD